MYRALLVFIVLGIALGFRGISQGVAQPRPTATTVFVTGVVVPDLPFPVDPIPIEFAIFVDARGLLNRSASARAEAVNELAILMEPSMSCKLGFGRVSSGGPWPQSKDTAALVAGILITEYREMTAGTSFSTSGTGGDPFELGNVDLQLFFVEGCDPTFVSATPVPGGTPIGATPAA